MEAVAVLIMLSHHLQGYYVISNIFECKIACHGHFVVIFYRDSNFKKQSFSLLTVHVIVYSMQQIIYLGLPMLAG